MATSADPGFFNTSATAGLWEVVAKCPAVCTERHFAPTLTSAVTRGEDDLVFAGTKGGASMPTYEAYPKFSLKKYSPTAAR